MKPLTKSAYMRAKACRRLAWIEAREGRHQAEATAAEKLRRDLGESLSRCAQDLFPGGLSAWHKGMSEEQARTATAALVADPSVPAIFEAAFLVDGLSARADVLERTPDGWILHEVKSGKTPKNGHFEDLAFQVRVLEKAGIRVRGTGLIMLNPAYRGGMPLDGLHLLTRFDTGSETSALRAKVARRVVELQEVLEGPEPAPARVTECRECLLMARCWGELPPDDILFLSGARSRKMAAWEGQGWTRIGDLPASELSPQQIAAQEAIRFGAAWRDGPAPAPTGPIAYVDFESEMPAIPYLPDCGPFEDAPYQFSCWIEEEPRTLAREEAFLWPQTEDELGLDPRPLFVEALLRAVEGAETIVFYSGFETDLLKRLTRAGIPGAERALELFETRGFDLEKVVKQQVRHPDLRGYTSIKQVLPALCPEMALEYKTLPGVANGDDAGVAIAEMRSPQTIQSRRAERAAELLAYCGLDARAMAHVLWAIQDLPAAP
ncbi:MAG: DUF2779 domain-containing protein [Fimbriimonadaceae bacterium]|nr:DUF2779 domain-containing protein [Fimbriimonadaceae bacterium]